MADIRVQRQLDLVSPPTAIWALLADCERLDRGLGQVPLRFRPLGDSDAAADQGAGFELFSERAGDGLRFFELPPDWQQLERLVRRRHYPKGPIAALESRFALHPQGQGSRLELELLATPRRGRFGLLLRLYCELSIRHLSRTLQGLDQALFRGENRLRRSTPYDELQLAALAEHCRAQLPSASLPLLEQLLSWLRSVDDLEADALRPGALAAGWEQPLGRVLEVCLTAAATGLLELAWDVVCPTCRRPAARYQNLSQLSAQVGCPHCAQTVVVELEQTVEVSFAVPHKLRSLLGRRRRPLTVASQLGARPTAYALGSPSRTPHVLTQLLLPAAGQLSMKVPSEPGHYLLALRGGLVGRLNISTLGPQTVQLVAGAALEPPELEVAMGGTIEIRHEHGRPRQLMLLRPEWPRQAAFAHDVTLHPRFRPLFVDGAGRSGKGDAEQRPQLLPPALPLGVGTVGLWQSELVGTIELFEQLGTTRASALVRQHLDALREAVERDGGSVVRSDREGLLAAFGDGLAAARSALAAQEAMASFRAASPDASPLGLRIGLFCGPCHLGTLHSALDYLGTSALLCTRLLREAHAGDIVLSAELGERLAAQPEGRSAQLGPRFALSVRGLAAPVAVARVQVAPQVEG